MQHHSRLLPLPLLLVALAHGPAAAQSATDFRLQPGAEPRAQGPVDPERPVTPTSQPPRQPAPAAEPAPAPAPIPTPTLAIPPAPTIRPNTQPVPARATASASRPTPAGSAPSPSASAPSASISVAPATPPAPTVLVPPTALPPTLAPAEPTLPKPSSAPASSATVAWWWLLPAALLGGIAAWFLLARRRSAAPAEPEFVRPRPVSPPLPGQPLPAASAAADPLDLELEPLRFSVSLVNATLHYRLALANRSAAPLGPLHIAADMIAAHASLPEAAQLGLDGSGLELRHELAALAPGESVELRGELRLPLAAVTPIRAGAAALLVPLVRLRVEGAGPSRTTALVVGEPPASPGGPLRPFRLDHGPRIFAAVSQRPLATAA